MDVLAAIVPSAVVAALFIGVMVTIFRSTDPRRSRDDAGGKGD
ncbi:hypothetical protein [Yinghuangia seranimata]|nr:hypothetical protein [Yinghuangia seranimata]MDI2128023.1 hypothetical protein [Yinghuangia seranimata]